jgi:hypothetical protein
VNLRALLDGIPHEDREWLRRHRSDVVGPGLPESVEAALRAAVEHMIEPDPAALDEE